MASRFFLPLLFFFFAGCGPQRFFYYPNRVLYADPDRLGIPNEIVSYPSLNGKRLYGVFFPADGQARGTVVHFHGNFGNLSNHFPLALFLTKRGFNVLAFDYQGYGASEGRPTPQHLVEDGIASVRYAVERSSASLPVAVFGQSLGGAVAIVAAAREPRVRAAVIESAFTGYRAMGSAVVARRVWTWPLFLGIPFLSHAWDPIRFIARIGPRPIFLLHGEADAIVPARMSDALFAAAKAPKTLWKVPGADHLGLHRAAGRAYEDRIVAFLEQSLAEETATKQQSADSVPPRPLQ